MTEEKSENVGQMKERRVSKKVARIGGEEMANLEVTFLIGFVVGGFCSVFGFGGVFFSLFERVDRRHIFESHPTPHEGIEMKGANRGPRARSENASKNVGHEVESGCENRSIESNLLSVCLCSTHPIHTNQDAG